MKLLKIGREKNTLECMFVETTQEERYIHLAMPGSYVETTLRGFLHEHPKRKQYSPCPCAQKRYGKGAQIIEEVPDSLPLSNVEQKMFRKQVQ